MLQTGTKIPKGYKHTEIGVIPIDWEVTHLSAMVTRVGSGITPTGGERVYSKEGRPFLRSQNVGWGQLLLEDLVFLTDHIHGTFPSSEIVEGDVLLNITGASIGRCAVADSRIAGGNVNQHVCEIRTNRKVLNPYYLSYYLLSSKGQDQIDSFQAGGNRQGLNYNQIRSFVVPRPPLPEQTVISTVLSDTDALIERLDKLIEKKRDIKHGAMQELLTGKRRLQGFNNNSNYKRTQIGVIPEDWDIVTYDQAFRFLRTASYSREQLSYGNTSYIHYGDIHTKWNNFVDLGNTLPTVDDRMIGNYSLIDDGDLIMADASEDYEGVGKSVEVINEKKIPAISGLHTLLLRDKGDYFAKGFRGYINENNLVKSQMERLATGLKVYGLSKLNLKLVQIPRPSLNEQTAIAQVLSIMSQEIECLEKKLEKYRQIKMGMMQQLLAGKIRIHGPTN